MNATLSRRSIMLGLAAAATAATVATVETPAPAESPALLALADALPATLKAYLVARDDIARIVAHYSPQWPVPSPDIIRYGMGCKPHCSIDGLPIKSAAVGRGIESYHDIGTPDVFAASAERYQVDAVRLSAKPGKRGLKHALFWADKEKALIEPARVYWDQVARMTKASGIEGAKARLNATRIDLHKLVHNIMTTEEATLSGVVIKAQALTAWVKVELFYQAVNPHAQAWACSLAQSIMRQGGAV